MWTTICATTRLCIKMVAGSFKKWREVATKFNIKNKEIERVASAFEHKDSI